MIPIVQTAPTKNVIIIIVRSKLRTCKYMPSRDVISQMPCIPLRGKVGGRCDDIILGLDKDGDLPTAGRFKDPH